MKAVLLEVFKSAGTNILLGLIDAIADEIRDRQDNPMKDDADRIKEITKRNKA
ncbi:MULTISPECIES: hypothetical protein [Vibrio harveyi group]|uniref:hypothetical protein n=1 Tax=Vibrio harveyi group TaxID=717610 RepID=UPI0012B99437|nr:hypothetical protein [Vibrio parahaemolyticus]MDG2761613.1 hypothetical protein [Vibrio parahaemolyticus]